MDIISISNLKWFSFYGETEPEGLMTIWQLIGAVLEAESYAEERLDQYVEALGQVEADCFDGILQDFIDGELKLFDRAGELLVEDQLNEMDIEKINIEQSEAKEYVDLLNEQRLYVTEENEAAYMVYQILKMEINKRVAGNPSLIKLSSQLFTKKGLNDASTELVKGSSLGKWSEMLQMNSLGLVTSLLNKSAKGKRNDFVQNQQKLICLMSHILSLLVPESCRDDKKPGSINIDQLQEFLSLNVNKKNSNFPSRRTVSDILDESRLNLVGEISTYSAVLVDESAGGYTMVDSSAKLRTSRVKLDDLLKQDPASKLNRDTDRKKLKI